MKSLDAFREQTKPRALSLRVLPPFAALALTLLLAAGVASAFSLHLEGISGAQVEPDSDALYASDAAGSDVLIAKVGMIIPDSGTIEDLGLPALTPDGKVLFGAAFREPWRNRYIWKIFVGDPNAARQRIKSALDLAVAPTDGCIPNLRTDPEPVADGAGGIVFIGHEAGGKDVLFRLAGARVECVARTGDRIDQTHALSLIAFGTAQPAQAGRIVFLGSVENGKQALLMASPKGGLKTLAVEDEAAPGGGRYSRPTRFAAPFGVPSVLASGKDAVVAFTAYTSLGEGLFLYRGGRMRRLLAHGARSPMGRVTFLSRGRPGLMADGTVALLTACGHLEPALLRVERDGRVRGISRSGDSARDGVRLVAFGSPFLTSSGAVFFEAADSEDRQAIYRVVGDGPPAELVLQGGAPIGQRAQTGSAPRGISLESLVINQRGDVAYLGAE